MGRYLQLLVLFFLFSCGKEGRKVAEAQEKIAFRGIDIPHKMVAGDSLALKFEVDGGSDLVLLLEKSFGPSLIKPTFVGDLAVFSLPPEMLAQSGMYHWQLRASSQLLLRGHFEVLPNIETTASIETYFGPRGIRAGGGDFSMLFMVPLDAYDNPLPDGTLLRVHQLMDKGLKTISVTTKNGYAFQNLYSSDKAGRMLVNAAVHNVRSKELTSVVSPSNSVDFSIAYQRVHDFADGNQVVLFKTSPLRDRYGNQVADGTLVNFSIVDQRGARLKTQGTTLAGVATGRILHPTEASEWKVTAYVTGESKSNTMDLDFKTAVGDFKVAFSQGHRRAEIGPILGFMGQLVPDGLLITLHIRDANGKLIDTKTTHTYKGKASFDLPKRFYPGANYQLIFDTADIKKEFQVALTDNGLE
ncbi:hypothetical protein [Pseudozobellia thermophila]|uniref:Uncharacterized protein n=1 Tax=Pseudozobellia thermophila TaxID=192903 RepID=A0A1M6I243_9FLAO|nr:hypothetical protein [Pseudozobellia thermophila]SHJ28518.1 hypothetical protein SAMN04488513_103295 [Pseudozobellia thermophila]